jgi:hypothetical protein
MTDTDYIEKILPRVKQHADAVVQHEFATMLNPKYRGPNWRWDKFVDFATRWAKTTVWQSFTDAEWKRWQKKIESDARRIAKITAERLMKESGILEWWPSNEALRTLLDEAHGLISGQNNPAYDEWCARVEALDTKGGTP